MAAVVSVSNLRSGWSGMRFELSKSPPSYANRRLQLRMLGFVGVIAVVLFAVTIIQSRQQQKTSPKPLPGSPDASVYDVRNEEQTLQEGEFVSRPGDDDPESAWQEPPGMPGEQSADPGTEADHRLDQQIARLSTRFNRSILRRVKDNTFGIRREEADAYYRLLDHAQKVAPGELEQAGSTDVLYINLMTEPQRFRGEPVTIQGDLWRLYQFEASPNEYGFGKLYEAWIFTADSANHPYRVVCTELPRGMQPGENLRKPVRVTGYFFKREGYETTGGMHVAPTLLAHRLLEFRPPNAAPSTETIVPYMVGLISAVGLAFLVTLVSFAISDRRAGRAGMLRDLNAPHPTFEGITAGSALSVEESLQQIAADEWKSMADATNPGHEEVSAALRARDRTPARPPTSPAAPISEGQNLNRTLDQARILKDWSAQRNGAVTPPIIPAPENSSGKMSAGKSEPQASPSAPIAESGLSKLAAWEQEIRQMKSSSETEAELTEEQRVAREELKRDQAASEQELNDRLLQQRAELDDPKHERHRHS